MSDTRRGGDSGDIGGTTIDTLPQLLDDYLDDTDLARELDVCPRTIQRWRRLGTAPPVTKVGKKNITRRGTAREWLRSREQAVEA